MVRTVSVHVSSPGLGVPSVGLHGHLSLCALPPTGRQTGRGHLLSCRPPLERIGRRNRQRNPEWVLSRPSTEVLLDPAIFETEKGAVQTRFQSRPPGEERRGLREVDATVQGGKARRHRLKKEIAPPTGCAAASRCCWCLPRPPPGPARGRPFARLCSARPRTLAN